MPSCPRVRRQFSTKRICRTIYYSRYDNRIFDPAHKLERHKTVFPKDMERAKALGRMLVS